MRSLSTIFSFSCFLSGAIGCLIATSQAGVVTFGTGASQFSMEFVTIGNPGNAADTTGNPSPAGSVGYTYEVGKFEVSRSMIEKYNLATENSSLQITLADMTIYGGNGTSKPATGISWNEAARFVNWLNTSTRGFAAYKFTTNGINDNIALWTAADTLDYDATNPYRSLRAKYVLPTYNEWYKAAYYSPSNSTYYDFPNGKNTAPDKVTSDTRDNTAVYDLPVQQGPADVTQAGGLSPYGVMGLGGNVYEWEESPFNLSGSISGSSVRALRGGDWDLNSLELSSSTRGWGNPGNEFDSTGFRVANLSSSAPPEVPEPSTMLIGTMFGLGGLLAKRRLKR